MVMVDNELQIEDRFLINSVRHNRTLSIYRLRADVGITVCLSTIKRKLYEEDVFDCLGRIRLPAELKLMTTVYGLLNILLLYSDTIMSLMA